MSLSSHPLPSSSRLYSPSKTPTLYPFDHFTPPSSKDSTIPPAILYFHPSSELFPPLLKLVRSFSELPLVVRYRSDPTPEVDGTRSGVTVGGWGVEMVLKKMEYSSVDDRGKAVGERDASEFDSFYTVFRRQGASGKAQSSHKRVGVRC